MHPAYTESFGSTRPRNLRFWLRYFLLKYFPNLSISALKRKTASYEERVENSKSTKNEALGYYSEKTGLAKEKILHTVSIIYKK